MVITDTLPFCEGELGGVYPPISTSSSTFFHLEFSVDLRGLKCHPCFKLFTTCPTLPEYSLLIVVRGKVCSLAELLAHSWVQVLMALLVLG